jgi:hypothetical protein
LQESAAQRRESFTQRVHREEHGDDREQRSGGNVTEFQSGRVTQAPHATLACGHPKKNLRGTSPFCLRPPSSRFRASGSELTKEERKSTGRKDPPLLAGGGCGGLRGRVVVVLPGKEFVVGRTGGLVLLMAFTAGGLGLASFAGAGTHRAWTFVPPAYGFGRGVEGSGILARVLFAMGFGPFVFV